MRRKKNGEDSIAVATDDGIGPDGTQKPKETKAERFRRLAMRRVPKAIKAMAAVTNLANRAVYEYTEEQREKVIEAIGGEVSRLVNAYNGVRERAEGFSL